MDKLGSVSASSFCKNSSVKLCGVCVVIAHVHPVVLHLHYCAPSCRESDQQHRKAALYNSQFKLGVKSKRNFQSCWELGQGSEAFPSPTGIRKQQVMTYVILI